MSLGYQAVGWNRQKKIYDALLAGGVALYLGLFIGLGLAIHPNATAETLMIRGLGTAAFLLLDRKSGSHRGNGEAEFRKLIFHRL